MNSSVAQRRLSEALQIIVLKASDIVYRVGKDVLIDSETKKKCLEQFKTLHV